MAPKTLQYVTPSFTPCVSVQDLSTGPSPPWGHWQSLESPERLGCSLRVLGQQ